MFPGRIFQIAKKTLSIDRSVGVKEEFPLVWAGLLVEQIDVCRGRRGIANVDRTSI
jgi:hypothetical protein